jgi:glucans biosynthesis protein
MHGGAFGSGAPQGNSNARKHGLYTQEAIGRRRALKTLMQRSREMLEEME